MQQNSMWRIAACRAAATGHPQRWQGLRTPIHTLEVIRPQHLPQQSYTPLMTAELDVKQMQIKRAASCGAKVRSCSQMLQQDVAMTVSFLYTRQKNIRQQQHLLQRSFAQHSGDRWKARAHTTRACCATGCIGLQDVGLL